MNPKELRKLPMRNRRTRILVGALSLVIAGAGFSAPAKAYALTTGKVSWEVQAEAISSTQNELKSEIADGSLDLIVVRNVNDAPVIDSAHLSSNSELVSTLTKLKNDPTVVAIEPDRQVHLMSAPLSAPPYFSSQWGLGAVGSDAASVSTSTQGASVIVAVVDSGVDAGNPDLSGKVMDGVDYRDGISYLNNSGTLIDHCTSYTDQVPAANQTHADFGKYDPNGHGTHVAGIIASNGIGVRSVAPQAIIMPVRVISPQGTGDMADVACGIIYAAEHGAKVINLSIVATQDSPALNAAVAYAISKGLVVVAAAGNGGPSALPSFPAAYPNVIGVGAVDQYGAIANFSNNGDYVDVVAPGVDIWSTCTSPGTVCTTTDGDPNYESLSGTSMATPFVSGLAALIFAMDPHLNNSDVEGIITSSAVDKGATGKDQIYGFGLINAPAAVDKSKFVSALKAQQMATAQAAAAKAAADKVAADKAAADLLAAQQAAAYAISVPGVAKSLNITKLSHRKLDIRVAAPAKSKIYIQRKSGSQWLTVKTYTATAHRVVALSRSGSYRLRIVIPLGTITTSAYTFK